MAKILFVSHDASRTGAPIVLLHFLRWLKTNTNTEISILLINGGELKAEFELIGEVFTWNVHTQPAGRIERIKRIFGKSEKKTVEPHQERYLKSLSDRKIDLLYLNTVVSHSLIPYFKEYLSCPILSHIHENEYSIRYYYNHLTDASYWEPVNKFIAASIPTAENLVRNFNVDKHKVKVFNEFVPIKEPPPATKTISEIRKELDLHDDFIVGGCGLTSWRKGVDLFISIAKSVIDEEKRNDISFVWVGKMDREFEVAWAYEMERLNLKGKLKFTGAKVDVYNYFQVFDLFLLPSREDPFPLVCLEVASLGKPIICFDEAGGIPELVGKDGGVVIPYSDIKKAKEAIVAYSNDREMVRLHGDQVLKSVMKYDVHVMAPQIFSYIESISG